MVVLRAIRRRGKSGGMGIVVVRGWGANVAARADVRHRGTAEDFVDAPPPYCHTPGGSVRMEEGILGRGEGRRKKGMALRAIRRRVKSGGMGEGVGGPDVSARADGRRRGTAEGFVGRRDGWTAAGLYVELVSGGGADGAARADVRYRETGEGFGDRGERCAERGMLRRSSCDEDFHRAIVEGAVEGRRAGSWGGGPALKRAGVHDGPVFLKDGRRRKIKRKSSVVEAGGASSRAGSRTRRSALRYWRS